MHECMHPEGLAERSEASCSKNQLSTRNNLGFHKHRTRLVRLPNDTNVGAKFSLGVDDAATYVFKVTVYFPVQSAYIINNTPRICS